MNQINVAAFVEHRRKFHLRPPCAVQLEKHTWVHVLYHERLVAIVCTTCGRYPIEIMDMWPIHAR